MLNVQVQVKQKGRKSRGFTVYDMDLIEMNDYLYYSSLAFVEAKKRQSPELTLKVAT